MATVNTPSKVLLTVMSIYVDRRHDIALLIYLDQQPTVGLIVADSKCPQFNQCVCCFSYAIPHGLCPELPKPL